MKLVPVLLVSAVFVAIGFRLFRSGAEGAGQERWLAGFFVGVACGLPLRIAGVEVMLASGSGGPQLNALGHLALSLATIAITLFVWRVFRPEEAWAQALAVAYAAGQIALLPLIARLGGLHDESAGVVVLANVSRTLPLLWAFLESLRYRSAMRKRVKLGLADPVVSNRFSLFALWTGSLAFLPCVVLIIRLHLRGTGFDASAVGGDDAHWIMPLIRVSMLAGASTAAVAIWLSFFPPHFYTNRLAARDTSQPLRT